MSYLCVFLILFHFIGIQAYLLGLEHRNELMGQNVAESSPQLEKIPPTSAFEGKPVGIYS